MLTLKTFNKENYGLQKNLIFSEIKRLNILGALEPEYQNKVTTKIDAIGLTKEREKKHRNVVKDPDDEELNYEQYKLQNEKYRRYLERINNEENIKTIIFMAIPEEHQNNLKRELEIQMHHAASITQILKFLEKTFGIVTQIERRINQKKTLTTLPLPNTGETGKDMLIKINDELSKFRTIYLSDKSKNDADIHLKEIILDAVDATPEIKKLFYQCDEYGEDYQSVCRTLSKIYTNIEMTTSRNDEKQNSRNDENSANYFRSRSPERIKTNRNSSRSKSPQRGRSNWNSISPARPRSPYGKERKQTESYCKYHKTRDHNTSECNSFRKLVIQESPTVRQWIDDEPRANLAEKDYDIE